MRDISHQCQGRERGAVSCCCVLFVYGKVPLGCVCVCVLLRAMEAGWGDRASSIPNDYWVCLTRWHPAESTWLAHGLALVLHTVGSQKELLMYVHVHYAQLKLNSNESKGHVIPSLIVMFKSLQTKWWKIPNRGGHAHRPPDLDWKRLQSMFIQFYSSLCRPWRRKTTFACKLVSDLCHVWTSMNNPSFYKV